MTVKETDDRSFRVPMITSLTRAIVDECFNEVNDKLHEAVLTYEDKGLSASKEVKLRVGKLLAIARNDNTHASNRSLTNVAKSRNRLKELLLKLMNDEGAVSVSLSSPTAMKTPVVIFITGDGERDAEQLAKRIFYNAVANNNCLSNVELAIHDGSIRTVDVEVDCINDAYKGLTLKSAELGFISHTMYDINKLAGHYDVSAAKGDKDRAELRKLCIALNAKAANDTSVKYYSIDSKKDNCLIERLIGLSD